MPDKRKKKGLSESTNYGRYMKLWIFKTTTTFAPKIMVDFDMRKDEDWQQFSAPVEKYGK